MNDKELKPCPCGETPKDLCVTDAEQGGKWAIVSGLCCGDWEIEFCTDYYAIDSDEYKALGIEAWNEAKRASGNESTKQIAQAAIDTMRANGYVHIDELIKMALRNSVVNKPLAREAGAAHDWLKQFKAEMHDWNRCPTCGGEADNGHDRCLPPSAYLCSQCQEEL